jgi:NADH:ubiquinone oxidoreductase subunit F (NADH-binding)
VSSLIFDNPVHFPLSGHAAHPGAGRQDLPDHHARYGRPLSGHQADVLIERIANHSLTGRGGAHFCVATKWRSVIEAGGYGYVVANGAESEPASAKDAALLQLRPHLVLDGLASAAAATNALEVVIWLHEGSLASQHSLTTALGERRVAGVVDPPIRVVTGPARYLSGESSAIINALSGGPALPAFTQRPAAFSGVHGRPTLLHNVETFARVGLIARAETHRTPPSSLLTLVGPHGRLVVDAPGHFALTDVLAEATTHGSGPLPTPQAVLIGGFGGTWRPWSEVADVPLDAYDRKLLGAGIFGMLPQGACGIAETARILTYLAASSARQCGPCMFGLSDLSTVMDRVAAGRSRRSDVKRLETFAAQIAGRGGCHLPDGAIRMLETGMQTFADDLWSHAKKKRCTQWHQQPLLPIPTAA